MKIMIRVLHVVSSMNRGGLETFIMNIYRKIDRSKIQFDFLIHTNKKCDYSEEIKMLGGNLYTIPSRNQGVFKNRKALDCFFKNHSEYEIIHQHSSSLSYVEPLKYAKKYNIPVRIIHSHSTKPGKRSVHKYLHKWNQLFIKSYATNYLACSKTAAKWLFKKEMYRKSEYSIVNNSIDLDEFLFDIHIRKETRRELGLENKFVVGHVGRFAYPKNHEFLIDTFNAMQGKDPSTVLLLVGEGELKSMIEKKVFDLGLNDKVIFTGVRDDISNLLQSMDVFVFPSRYEGLPVTLIEAQATGLPCVISDVITKEVMITDHIKKLPLNLDAEQWGDLALEYKDTVERKEYHKELKQAGFSISTTVKELKDLYMKKV